MADAFIYDHVRTPAGAGTPGRIASRGDLDGAHHPGSPRAARPQHARHRAARRCRHRLRAAGRRAGREHRAQRGPHRGLADRRSVAGEQINRLLRRRASRAVNNFAAHGASRAAEPGSRRRAAASRAMSRQPSWARTAAAGATATTRRLPQALLPGAAGHQRGSSSPRSKASRRADLDAFALRSQRNSGAPRRKRAVTRRVIFRQVDRSGDRRARKIVLLEREEYPRPDTTAEGLAEALKSRVPRRSPRWASIPIALAALSERSKAIRHHVHTGGNSSRASSTAPRRCWSESEGVRESSGA